MPFTREQQDNWPASSDSSTRLTSSIQAELEKLNRSTGAERRFDPSASSQMVHKRLKTDANPTASKEADESGSGIGSIAMKVTRITDGDAVPTSAGSEHVDAILIRKLANNATVSDIKECFELEHELKHFVRTAIRWGTVRYYVLLKLTHAGVTDELSRVTLDRASLEVVKENLRSGSQKMIVFEALIQAV